MIKVLHVTHWYPNDTNPTSGSFISDQCEAIHNAENTDSLLLFFDLMNRKGLIPRFSQSMIKIEGRIPVVTIRVQWLFSPMLFMLPKLQWILFQPRIRQVLQDFQPDLIHGHVIHPSGEIVHKIAEHFSLPHVLSEHWSNLIAFFRKKSHNSWGYQAYKNAVFIFPVSSFLQRLVCSQVNDLDPSRVVVVPNVVNPNSFYPMPRTIAANELKFIMVSSWIRYKQATKRPDLIFEALESYARGSNKSVSLTVVGGGNMLEELKGRAAKMSISILFTGPISREEIGNLMRQHDYFLHASEIETFSVVTAEALMCGLPCVVSKAGALPDLVTPDRGIVAINTVTDWVEAIRKVTATQFDRNKIAQDVTRLCSAEAIGRQIRNSYNVVLDRK
jgi:glycosyltransferase involved in cell wall biosynthesis